MSNLILNKIIDNIDTDWKDILKCIISNKPELDNLCLGDNIYPPKDKIFNAFNKFNFEQLKIVILGQDPYHRKGQANGLCFSVEENIKIPPSLKNIFKEIKSDLGIVENIDSGNLEYLSEQGILLLNNTLTVEEGKPNSHLKYWKGFSDNIIEYISKNSNNIIFILWGNNAKKSKKFISDSHMILEASHPSPLAANKGGWWGNRHFSKSNKKLKELGKDEISWLNI